MRGVVIEGSMVGVVRVVLMEGLSDAVLGFL
jgi:hypothetical protein